MRSCEASPKSSCHVATREYSSSGSERLPLAHLAVLNSSFTALVKSKSTNILALIGRRDFLSDGVWDYCKRLADALRPHGLEMELSELDWERSGWAAALRRIRSQLQEARFEWALLQYTAIGWSKRGIPVGALVVAWIVKRQRVRLAVVFHEPYGFQARGTWARFRFAFQQWVIRRLYTLADAAIFTVSMQVLPWLRPSDPTARMIPIGSNIPENLAPRELSRSADVPKTVAVFCVTSAGRTAWEVAEIAAAVRHARESVPRLRLVVFGRGALEARCLLEKALAGSDIELSISGVLPATDVARILSEADALLYVRDALMPQRGSALAAVACGLPLVAYGDEAVCFPLSEAGILLARPGDRRALWSSLVRVLTDETVWASLHHRSLSAYRKYFAWDEIARKYAAALQVQDSPSPANALQPTLATYERSGDSFQVVSDTCGGKFQDGEVSNGR